jgi:hypothetical protein
MFRVTSTRPSQPASDAAFGVAVLAGGALAFLGATWILGGAELPDALVALPQFPLWVVMVAGLIGLAGASCVVAARWLREIAHAFVGRVRVAVTAWLVAPFVVAALFAGTTALGFALVGQPGALNSYPPLSGRLNSLTAIGFVLELPALAGLVAVFHIATDGDTWRYRPARDRFLLVRTLRRQSRRVLALLGTALTWLVINTGMRREVLLAYNTQVAAADRVDVPREAVLLYGLAFAVFLGVLYLVAAQAIDRRAEAVVDDLVDFPDPADSAFTEAMNARAALRAATGTASSFAAFQTSVIIAAPLLSALIGIAVGS